MLIMNVHGNITVEMQNSQQALTYALLKSQAKNTNITLYYFVNYRLAYICQYGPFAFGKRCKDVKKHHAQI